MSSPPPAIAARFALLIAGLCQVVAAHIAQDRDAGPWIIRVWNRLQRINRCFERLVAQIGAGTVPKQRAGFTRAKPSKPATRPPIVLAGKPAWLIRAVQKTAVYAGYLQQLLDDPEMAALLTASPQLAGILRPLCRALGVPPPRMPRRPIPPRPALSATPPLPDAVPAEPTDATWAKPALPADTGRPPRAAAASRGPARCNTGPVSPGHRLKRA